MGVGQVGAFGERQSGEPDGGSVFSAAHCRFLSGSRYRALQHTAAGKDRRRPAHAIDVAASITARRTLKPAHRSSGDLTSGTCSSTSNIRGRDLPPLWQRRQAVEPNGLHPPASVPPRHSARRIQGWPHRAGHGHAHRPVSGLEVEMIMCSVTLEARRTKRLAIIDRLIARSTRACEVTGRLINCNDRRKVVWYGAPALSRQARAMLVTVTIRYQQSPKRRIRYTTEEVADAFLVTGPRVPNDINVPPDALLWASAASPAPGARGQPRQASLGPPPRSRASPQ